MYPRLINQIKKAIENKKGEDIKVYNVKNKNPLFDYVVICTGLNEKNMEAIASNIEETLETESFDIKSIEGVGSNDWILVDCYDVIVHIMSRSYRDHVKLDELITNNK